MTLVMCANFIPDHTFPVILEGISGFYPQQFNTLPQYVNVENPEVTVSPVISSIALPDTITTKDIEYSWYVRKSGFRQPVYLNASGPHKIYVIYDNPTDDQYAKPPHTFGLDKVCIDYARGETEISGILEAIMHGIYGEFQVTYEPGQPYLPGSNPYKLLDVPPKTGDCDAYARAFLVLSQSAGIATSKVTIWDGYMDDANSKNIFYRWNYLGDDTSVLNLGLFCKPLTDPQGHNGLGHGQWWPAGNWGFNEHVVGNYSNTLYDPVFDIKGDKDLEYGKWFRYYYLEPMHNEPPYRPPCYYIAKAGENPWKKYKYLVFENFLTYFCHPRDCERLTDNAGIISNPHLYNNKIYSSAAKNPPNVKAWPELYNREISEFIDTLCGVYYPALYISIISPEMGRTFRKKAPGDYLSPPFYGCYDEKKHPPQPLGSLETGYLESSLSGILTKSNWDSQILDHIQQYDNILNDSSRSEFHGRMAINGKKFAFGGWFGKLTVAGVYDDYDGVAGFISNAKTYFQLPEIRSSDVKIVTGEDNFFYSYLDRKNMFWLRGYRVQLSTPDVRKDVKWKVIELLKYYDKEFVP